MKPLSFLSPVELRELASSLHSANFSGGEVIFSEEALATGVHFLLRGVAKITCLNRSDGRGTVALLAPGPIPEFLSSPVSQWHFRCEAYSDCRIGRIAWDQFDLITKATSPSALRTFHENNLMQWYRWSLSFLGLDLRERLLSVLRQLCSNFGVVESRGTLLRIPVSHKDLADLVGATRPRITEHLAELEREHVLIRQGRQLIVRLDKIENQTSVPAPHTNHSFAEANLPYLPKDGRLNDLRPLAAATSVRPPMRKPFVSPGPHLTNSANAHSLS
jgi:CRP/FNR family transcriptional regulator